MLRSLLIIFVMVSISLNAKAQRKITTYLDKQFHTLPSKKGAAFYREIDLDEQNNPKPEIHVYYMNGVTYLQAMKSYIDTVNSKNDI